MKHFHVSIAVSFLFLAVLFPFIKTNQTSVNAKNLAVPQPVDTPDLFSLSTNEIKELKKNLKDETVKLDQATKFDQINRDLENTRIALEVLDNSIDDKNLPEDLSATLNNNLKNLQSFRQDKLITREDVTEIHNNLNLIMKEADKVIKDDPCDPPMNSFSITAIVIKGNKETDKEFQVYYRDVSDDETTENAFAEGGLVTATDNVTKGMKYFWTKDPNSSGKSGDQARRVSCKSKKEITLLAP